MFSYPDGMFLDPGLDFFSYPLSAFAIQAGSIFVGLLIALAIWFRLRRRVKGEKSSGAQKFRQAAGSLLVGVFIWAGLLVTAMAVSAYLHHERVKTELVEEAFEIYQVDLTAVQAEELLAVPFPLVKDDVFPAGPAGVVLERGVTTVPVGGASMNVVLWWDGKKWLLSDATAAGLPELESNPTVFAR